MRVWSQAKCNIPIKICDTFRPHLDGTVITTTSGDVGVVKAISVRHGISIVNLESLGMWQQAGFLADAFRAFKTQVRCFRL
jgi:diaminopimelate decarboxylase/aspartate kinase